MANPEPQQPLPRSQPVGPRRLGLFPDSYATESTTLVLHDKWFSKLINKYTITTADEHDFLQIHGENGEFASQDVKDMNGKLLYSVHRKPLHYPAKYYWKNPQGETILEVNGEEHHGLLTLYKMKVKFRNAQDGKGVELELEGDAGNNTGVINCGDMGTVVTIRKTNSALTSLFTGNYQEVTISPNVDRVLAVGLVICINERWEYSSKEKDPKEELLRGAVEELRDLSQGG